MKTIIGLILISFILVADSPKHNFTFTIEINGINLKQAAELEREIIELVEKYKNASVKVEMEEVKQIYEKEYLEVDSLDNLRFIIPRSGSWMYIDTNE